MCDFLALKKKSVFFLHVLPQVPLTPNTQHARETYLGMAGSELLQHFQMFVAKGTEPSSCVRLFKKMQPWTQLEGQGVLRNR